MSGIPPGEGNQRPRPRPRPPPKMTMEEAAKKRRIDPGPGPAPCARSAVVVSHSREATWARNRATLNAARVTQECAPYLEEGRLIKQRVALLTHEIERIGLQLDRFRITLIERHGLLQGSTQAQTHIPQKDIFSLQTLYALERVQKEEERMRLQDRLTEINEIIRSIYRKYEDTRHFNGLGGRSTRTRTSARSKTKKHKWSLKYKRSIDCKRPKGFSQRQYCKNASS